MAVNNAPTTQRYEGQGREWARTGGHGHTGATTGGRCQSPGNVGGSELLDSMAWTLYQWRLGRREPRPKISTNISSLTPRVCRHNGFHLPAERQASGCRFSSKILVTQQRELRGPPAAPDSLIRNRSRLSPYPFCDLILCSSFHSVDLVSSTFASAPPAVNPNLRETT